MRRDTREQVRPTLREQVYALRRAAVADGTAYPATGAVCAYGEPTIGPHPLCAEATHGDWP